MAPAPGKTPTIKPNTEDRATVGATSFISERDSFILLKATGFIVSLVENILPRRMVIMTSAKAKVAMANNKKLMPSTKSICPKVYLGAPVITSLPTVAIIKPNTVIIMALITCPFPAKAATEVRPNSMRAK